MFDISVALMCYGVNIAVGNARMGGDGRVRFVPLVKKIFSSHRRIFHAPRPLHQPLLRR